jgi:hypothetical protein
MVLSIVDDLFNIINQPVKHQRYVGLDFSSQGQPVPSLTDLVLPKTGATILKIVCEYAVPPAHRSFANCWQFVLSLLLVRIL